MMTLSSGFGISDVGLKEDMRASRNPDVRARLLGEDRGWE